MVEMSLCDARCMVDFELLILRVVRRVAALRRPCAHVKSVRGVYPLPGNGLLVLDA